MSEKYELTREQLTDLVMAAQLDGYYGAYGDAGVFLDDYLANYYPRYELTDLGKAYRDAMQRGAKLNGGVKAGED